MVIPTFTLSRFAFTLLSINLSINTYTFYLKHPKSDLKIQENQSRLVLGKYFYQKVLVSHPVDWEDKFDNIFCSYIFYPCGIFLFYAVHIFLHSVMQLFEMQIYILGCILLYITVVRWSEKNISNAHFCPAIVHVEDFTIFVKPLQRIWHIIRVINNSFFHFQLRLLIVCQFYIWNKDSTLLQKSVAFVPIGLRSWIKLGHSLKLDYLN